MGHLISEEGIAIDPKNIATIMEWPTPKDVSDMIYFMGLEDYYRRFIKRFSKIENPITSL